MFYLNSQANNKLLPLGGIFEIRIQFEFSGDVLWVREEIEKWKVVFKCQKTKYNEEESIRSIWVLHKPPLTCHWEVIPTYATLFPDRSILFLEAPIKTILVQ